MISVVVATVDRPQSLRRLLEALAAGTRAPDEVVVVDQGADPGTGRAVADGRTLGLDVVHLRQARLGLSASQNLGVRTARSPVVAVIDDDCLPERSWLQVVARTFAEPDGPELLGGRILPLPEDGERTVAVSTRKGELPRDLRWPAPAWQLGSGGNFAVRRERYLAVAGNDERLGTGTPGRAGNDLDLFHRVLRSGALGRYEPDLVVHHERVTPAERRARRGSYGFGVGACVGRWARERDRAALRVLLAWFRLRLRGLRRRRSVAALGDELVLLGGTVRGLVYGLRLTPWPPDR